MIFGSVIRRAEAAVDNILEQAMARVAVAALLIIAGGFATAALTTYLTARYGVGPGYLIMAGLFATLGLIAAVYVSVRTPASAEAAAEAQAKSEATPALGEEQPAAALPFSEAERELVTSALTSAVPIALPAFVRMLLRNIPLVVLILVIGYIFSRKETGAVAPAKAEPGAPAA